MATSADEEYAENLCRCLENLYQMYTDEVHIIMGDVNLPDMLWGGKEWKKGKKQHVYKLVQKLELMQYVTVS